MKKKIILTLVIISVLVCLLALSSSAENFTYEGVNYTTATDSETGETVAKVAANTTITTANVVIPSYVKDASGKAYKVVGFTGENFKNNANIVTLKISSEFITEIPKYCFQTFGATTIYISSPITTFGQGCFHGLTSIESFTVDFSNTKTIGPNAFRFNTSNSVDWYGLDKTKTLNLYNVKTIGLYAFASSHLDGEKIIWPKELDVLDGFAFEGSNYSGPVYINATTIGDRTFNATNDITILIFGPRVTTISYNFSNANNAVNLQHVVFLADSVSVSTSGFFSDKNSNYNVYYKSLNYTFTDATEFKFATFNKYVISNVTMSYDNLCELSIVLSATSTQRVENGTLKDQDSAITLTDYSLKIENHNYVSQGINQEYCPLGSVEGFKCPRCQAIKDAFAEGITPVKGHNHTALQSFTFENGYSQAGTKVYACTGQDCESEQIVNTEKGLITYLGYSIKADGRALCVGYEIDKNAISEYEALYNSITIKYGVVATVAQENETTGSPLNNDLTANTSKYGNVIFADITTSDVKTLEFKLVGDFTAYNACDKALLMSAYITDGSAIEYVQDKEDSSVIEAVTYNQILEI